jgi:GT2 family glycosyltransferase
MVAPEADVAVVITYYEQNDRLRSILRALEDQRGAGALEVVVADDGSRRSADLSTTTLPVTVVRQEDHGVRPGRARNLGASMTTAPIIVFLDGDMVPDPSFVEAITAPLRAGRADVTVGRRLHADFAGLTWDEVADWVRARTDDRRLPEPTWLLDGYRSTDNLTSGSPAVFRYVISACLAVRREVLEATGGFDPDFDTYGGEDWEFAHRCWCAGFDFEHVPDAVAVHDGPDWALRRAAADVDERRRHDRTKTLETIRLASLVTEASARGRTVLHRRPAVVVTLTLRPDDPASNAAALELLLEHPHTELRLVGTDEDLADLTDWIADDPRIVSGTARDALRAFTDHVAVRAWIEATEPFDVDTSTLWTRVDAIAAGRLARCRLHGADGAAVTITSARHLAACRRRLGRALDAGVTDRELRSHSPVVDVPEGFAPLVVADLERWLGARARRRG